jgi:hypothetical protein
VLALFGPAAAANLVASVLGVAWWVLAARQHSPSDLGVAGATIALATGLGTAATGGLYQVLLRVLPGRADARRVLWKAQGAAALLAATAGALAGAAGLGGGALPWPALTLALGAALWAVFAMQDAVLLALRAPSALFASNVTNAVAKLGLVAALAGSASGIVWSWLLPLAALVPVIGVVSHRLAAQRAPAVTTTRATPARHVGAEYVSSLSTLAVISGVPVIVAAVANPTLAGLAVTTWALFVAAEAASSILAGSVMVTVASGHRTLAESLRSLAPALLPGLAAAAAAVVLAPTVLAAFGPAYAAATGMLRLLVVAMVVRLAAHLGFAALRVGGRFVRLVFAQGTFAAVTLVGATVAASANSLTGLGMAALAGTTAAAGVALTQRSHHSVRATSRAVPRPVAQRPVAP